MSTRALLNLLNDLEKRDKMRGLSSILSLFRNDLREKPRNLLQSDEQCPGAPLSHLRKIPSATSGSNKGVKIVRKALSGAIARHSGDGKFYAMPYNEALVGG